MKRLLLAGCIIASLTIVACSGGGGGGTSPLPGGGGSNTQSTGKVSFTVLVPVATTQSGARKPLYVSPSTGSVSFQVPAMSAPQVVALILGSATCPLQSGNYVCTANAAVPVGASQTLTIKTYASTDGTGPVLSMNTQVITVVANQSNPVTVTLDGVTASISMMLSPTAVTATVPGSFSASASANDASGNQIQGQPTDQSGNPLGQGSLIPTLTCISPTGLAVCSSFTIGAFNSQNGGWTVTYDGTGGAGTVTFSLNLTGYTSATRVLTVNPSGTPTATPTASPSPTPVPTATPTASPTPTPVPTSTPTASPTPSPTPVSGLVNGNFETGDLTGWYICRAGHAALSTEVDPNPAVEGTPNPATAQATTADDPAAFGTPIPDPSAVTATVGAAGFTAPHGGSYAAQIGNVLTGTGHYREKGFVGICQDVAVPTSGPGLTMWVWEGGNVGWFGVADTEADVFGPGTTWVTGITSLAPTSAVLSGKQTTATPTATLFAETNCYNNANTSGGTSTSDYVDCAMGTAVVPPNTHGGQWRQKGPYDLTAYAGQTITIMIGTWSSSSSTGYYNYLYADDVVLSSGTTGTVPITVNRPMGVHR